MSAAPRRGSRPDGDPATIAAQFDLLHLPASFYDDPYPTYRALLRHAPVKRLPDGSLFLTRYADLDRIYRDTTAFTSDKTIEFAPKFGVGTPLYTHTPRASSSTIRRCTRGCAA